MREEVKDVGKEELLSNKSTLWGWKRSIMGEQKLQFY